MTSGAGIASTGIGADAAAITLDGTGGDGTSGNHGTLIQSAGTLITSVDGDILVLGQGGDGSTTNNFGVYQLTGAVISSTGVGAGAATITLDGTGGDGTSGNHGVFLSGAGALVTSVDGDISITGQGNTDGSSSGNHGIVQQTGAVVSSTGAGVDAAAITLHGTGGDGTSSNYGVNLNGALLTSVDGAIGITGIGGDGSAGTNYGVYQLTGAVISSTGTGADAATITIEGTGGAGTSSNEGVILSSIGTLVTSVDGDILIRGKATAARQRQLRHFTDTGAEFPPPAPARTRRLSR